MLELSVLMFCMIGCGMTCYNLGKQEGIESTIEHLVDQGMIQVEEDPKQMINKLVLEESEDGYYRVFDANSVYLITPNKFLAQQVYNQFKLEYREEQENASEV